MEPERIVLNILVHKPVNEVWKKWITPEDMEQWNIPSDSWRCLNVFNDFIESGLFCYAMETKDGRERIEHKSIYNRIVPYELIVYMLDDGRKSTVEFQQIDRNTIIRETFDPEQQTPLKVQQDLCQSVLERFKEYAEAE
ncbi:MAG TPA: SRPBCC domain-containing protein [Niabella sp.]|nr:SRPBCC domain-containing protein [Niabella sp.]